WKGLTRMDGVITAIVGFLLVGLIWPHLIKNRTQYYAAFGFVVFALLVQTFALMFSGTTHGPKLAVFGGVVTGFCVIAALLMCLACAGGKTVRELSGEVKGAYEVIRRGETEKEVIIPLRGQTPRERDAAVVERIEIDDAGNDRPAG
ncbi:MAG TPA: hypothetical protein PLD59_07490, partial [Tepidisphaeraceae bacterium]|nr:hypothetical protein [Tepidisphaeraceae bacterium]